LHKPTSVVGSANLELVSLFCGAGGLDLGFRQAGFDVAIALDHDSSFIGSYNKNCKKSAGQLADLQLLGVRGVLALVAQSIPIGSRIGVIGGPPCQGFSRANAKSRADDPRNKLAAIYLAIVDELSKKYVVDFLLIENVAGLLSSKHADTLSALTRKIKRLGFCFHKTKLDAVGFGVAQHRERVFMVGLRKEYSKKFSFPVPAKRRMIVRDVIADLPEPIYFARRIDPKTMPVHPNHWTMNPKSPKFSAPAAAGHSRSFKRLDWDKPSRTIAFGHREIHIHPNGKRRLSIYEAMLLQGFPKRYQLTGTLSSQVTQISNAVPPPLAKAVALKLKLALIESKNHG